MTENMRDLWRPRVVRWAKTILPRYNGPTTARRCSRGRFAAANRNDRRRAHMQRSRVIRMLGGSRQRVRRERPERVFGDRDLRAA